MGLFIALLLIPMLMQHISIKAGPVSYEKKNRRALAFFFILFIAMISLRHETIGNDTQNYLKFFSDFAKMPWGKIKEYGLEIGFAYFNKLVSLFTENPQIFLAIVSVLTGVLLYPTFKRLCVDPSLTIVLFCSMSTFFMMFSGVRQGIAIGLGCFAYEFVRKKKLIPFLLIVFLAMSFHASAFMLFLMFPLYHAKITKKWLLAVVPSLALVFLFNEQIFSYLLTFLERYTDKYDAEITATGAYTMIVLFFIFAVFAFVIPDEKKLDKETIGLRNFLLLALALQMFAPLHALAMRMNYYYIIFIPLLLPKIIAAREYRWKHIAILARYVMIGFFTLYFLMSLDGDGSLNVYPYHFFWEYVA